MAVNAPDGRKRREHGHTGTLIRRQQLSVVGIVDKTNRNAIRQAAQSLKVLLVYCPPHYLKVKINQIRGSKRLDQKVDAFMRVYPAHEQDLFFRKATLDWNESLKVDSSRYVHGGYLKIPPQLTQSDPRLPNHGIIQWIDWKPPIEHPSSTSPVIGSEYRLARKGAYQASQIGHKGAYLMNM